MDSNKTISVEETLNETRNRLLGSITESIDEENGIFSKIDSFLNKNKVEGNSTLSMLPTISESTKTDSYIKQENTSLIAKVGVCQSKAEHCFKLSLKNYNFCYKHILEDASSPFQRCSFLHPGNHKQCINPALKQEKKPSFCVLHSKDENLKNKNLKKKKRREPLLLKNQDSSLQKKRPSSLAINPDSPLSKQLKRDSSSGDEDYSFFTDTIHLKKTQCSWLGSQASDAESTDSEDENPLNHAGVWTLEEAVRIYKEKLMRLRHLYSEQYKHLQHHLKEEFRKFSSNHDTDPATLSKVPFYQHSGDVYKDYMENVHLSNYQQLGPEEIVSEKASKDKKTRGITLSGKRNDVPKCCSSSDGVRCSRRTLPLSKFCFNHILQDPDQYLYAPCMPVKGTCTEPADIINGTCKHHVKLMSRPTLKSWENYLSAKKARETRKKKKAEIEIDKESLKPTRTSARLTIKQSRSSVDETISSHMSILSNQKVSPLSNRSASVSENTIVNTLKPSGSCDNLAKIVEETRAEFTLLKDKDAIKDNDVSSSERHIVPKESIASLTFDILKSETEERINAINKNSSNQNLMQNERKDKDLKSDDDPVTKVPQAASTLIRLSEFANLQKVEEETEKKVNSESNLTTNDQAQVTVDHKQIIEGDHNKEEAKHLE